MPYFLTFTAITLGIIVVAYAMFSYVRIQKLIAISTELVNTTLPFENILPPPAPQVLFIGDSAGVGVGASHPTQSIAGLFSRNHPEYSISNKSVSGRRTAGLILLLASLPDKSYDLLIIQIEGNDTVHVTPIKKLEGEIEVVLQDARRVSPHVILYSTGNVGDAPLFPRPFAWFWEQRTRKVRSLFAKKAKQHNITYVDLYREKPEDPFYLKPFEYHTTDLFHPSDLGYAYWHEVLERSIEEEKLLK